ncbi:MAG: hypothetical protein ACE5DK_11735, partial [Paracoccaceae bacterium]
MREAIKYLELLGQADPQVVSSGDGWVGRDIIIVPPRHRELEKSRAEALLKRFSKNPHLDRVKNAPRRALVENAVSALEKLAQEAGSALLNEAEKLALEAIVIAEGVRPVVNFRNGRLDHTGVELGEWEQFTRTDAGIIEDVALSIGR